jgi:uncharacterized membrane protein
MEERLSELAQVVGLAIEFVAIIVIAIGSVEALIRIVRHLFWSRSGEDTRRVWMYYARWLVAGLTFQLAADIVHTSIAPTWDDVGKVGAIAAIRTFLTYFLDRDMEKVREQDAGA